MERHLRALAVHFGSRRRQHQLPFLFRSFQDDLRSVYVGLDGSNRTLDDQPDSHCRCKMHYDVGVIDQFCDQPPVLDGIQMVFHPFFRFQMPNVLHASGGKVIQQDHMVAAFE